MRVCTNIITPVHVRRVYTRDFFQVFYASYAAHFPGDASYTRRGSFPYAFDRNLNIRLEKYSRNG